MRMKLRASETQTEAAASSRQSRARRRSRQNPSRGQPTRPLADRAKGSAEASANVGLVRQPRVSGPTSAAPGPSDERWRAPLGGPDAVGPHRLGQPGLVDRLDPALIRVTSSSGSASRHGAARVQQDRANLDLNPHAFDSTAA